MMRELLFISAINRPKMACHKKTVLKYMSLAVGCLCTVAGGSIAAINAYSNDLRDTFNLSQSQGKTA